MLHKALGNDRRHDFVGVMDALAALKAKREGERIGDVFGSGGREGVVIVGHPGNCNRPIRTKKEHFPRRQFTKA